MFFLILHTRTHEFHRQNEQQIVPTYRFNRRVLRTTEARHVYRQIFAHGRLLASSTS